LVCQTVGVLVGELLHFDLYVSPYQR